MRCSDYSKPFEALVLVPARLLETTTAPGFGRGGGRRQVYLIDGYELRLEWTSATRPGGGGWALPRVPGPLRRALQPHARGRTRAASRRIPELAKGGRDKGGPHYLSSLRKTAHSQACRNMQQLALVTDRSMDRIENNADPVCPARPLPASKGLAGFWCLCLEDRVFAGPVC